MPLLGKILYKTDRFILPVLLDDDLEKLQEDNGNLNEKKDIEYSNKVNIKYPSFKEGDI